MKDPFSTIYLWCVLEECDHELQGSGRAEENISTQSCDQRGEHGQYLLHGGVLCSYCPP